MSEELKGAKKLSDDEMEDVVGGLAVSPAAQTVYRRSTGTDAKATTTDYRRKAGKNAQASPMGGKGKKGGESIVTGIC